MASARSHNLQRAAPASWRTCLTNSWWKKGTASWPSRRRTSSLSPEEAYSCAQRAQRGGASTAALGWRAAGCSQSTQHLASARCSSSAERPCCLRSPACHGCRLPPRPPPACLCLRPATAASRKTAAQPLQQHTPRPPSPPTCSMLRMLSFVSSNLNPAPEPQQRCSRSAECLAPRCSSHLCFSSAARLPAGPEMRPTNDGGSTSSTTALQGGWRGGGRCHVAAGKQSRGRQGTAVTPCAALPAAAAAPQRPPRMRHARLPRPWVFQRQAQCAGGRQRGGPPADEQRQLVHHVGHVEPQVVHCLDGRHEPLAHLVGRDDLRGARSGTRASCSSLLSPPRP